MRSIRPEGRIADVKWGTRAQPLAKPYELSFARLESYDSVWVRIEDDAGRVGLGEAVALPGYGWETTGSIQLATASMLEGASGMSAEALRERCRPQHARHPFAAAAIATALDMPDFLDSHRTSFAFPLNVPVAGATGAPELRNQVAAYLASGYSYVKVKVGIDLDAECEAARCLMAGAFDHEFRLVFDANQAFTTEQALNFADALCGLPQKRLLWFEQPVHRDDWNAMAEVCLRAGVPVLLDECIYTAADIDRAASMGAHGVKLKSFKQFGMHETLALARHARNAGLDVVYGNGVATDIGNLAELLVLEAGGDLFSPPGECSGFAKLAAPLMQGALQIEQGGRIASRLDPASLKKVIASFAG